MIGDNLEQADREEGSVGRYPCADHRLQMFTHMIGGLGCGAQMRMCRILLPHPTQPRMKHLRLRHNVQLWQDIDG